MQLKVQNLGLSFAQQVALCDVSLSLASGERVGLLGPNGAGKTSLLDCLAGQVRPSQGRIFLDDRDITSLPPHRRARLGLHRTFQHLGLVPSLSVLDNVQLTLDGLGGADRKTSKERAEAALSAVEFGGDFALLPTECPRFAQKSVALARVIVAQPGIVLLDEPGAGLSQPEKIRLAKLLGTTLTNTTLLIVEHDLDFLSEVTQRALILAKGELRGSVLSNALHTSPLVDAVYLRETTP